MTMFAYLVLSVVLLAASTTQIHTGRPGRPPGPGHTRPAPVRGQARPVAGPPKRHSSNITTTTAAPNVTVKVDTNNSTSSSNLSAKIAQQARDLSLPEENVTAAAHDHQLLDEHHHHFEALPADNASEHRRNDSLVADGKVAVLPLHEASLVRAENQSSGEEPAVVVKPKKSGHRHDVNCSHSPLVWEAVDVDAQHHDGSSNASIFLHLKKFALNDSVLHSIEEAVANDNNSNSNSTRKKVAWHVIMKAANERERQAASANSTSIIPALNLESAQHHDHAAGNSSSELSHVVPDVQHLDVPSDELLEHATKDI